jgi:hypothetical protein
MLSNIFLQNTFSAVLQNSDSIAGRFFVSTANGREINSDTLGQVLTEAITNNVYTQTYPCVLMAAPTIEGALDQSDSWARCRITLLFLRPSYIDTLTNTLAAANYNTNTSTRPITEDWSDMQRSAIMFLRMLNKVMRLNNNHAIFRLLKEPFIITPISSVGADRLSGVRLDFHCSLFIGCELEDYSEDPDMLASSIILQNV